MNKKFKRIAVGLLAGMLALSSVSMVGCDDEDGKTPPDYSKSTLQFEFYGYSSPTDGTWIENGVEMSAGQDFRTVERFREYKDAGMTIYFPQAAGNFSGGAWEGSKAQMCMDRAQEAGLTKTILTDNRILNMSKTEGSLIGEDKQYKTEAELDAYVETLMEPYVDHPIFYGVMLGDEPYYSQLEAYGQMYKSIKRVHPDVFVQANLLPMSNSLPDRMYGSLSAEEAEGLSPQEQHFELYRRYIRTFLDYSGADYIMYDQYPMMDTFIHNMYIPCLQITAEIAKEYGVKLYNVTQTMRMVTPNSATRYMQENDAYWLNNMLVGFGVKQIAYFTYWTKQVYDSGGEQFFNNGSFINRDGTRTELYDIMKKIMAEEQKLAPTVLNFDYVTCNSYRKKPCIYNSQQVDAMLEGEEFKLLDEVSIDKEVALVTELYDKNQKVYMYMLQNVVDPLNKGANAYQAITADFDDSCTHAVVFKKGEREIVKLDKGGKLTIKQQPGHAVYVIPY